MASLKHRGRALADHSRLARPIQPEDICSSGVEEGRYAPGLRSSFEPSALDCAAPPIPRTTRVPKERLSRAGPSTAASNLLMKDGAPTFTTGRAEALTDTTEQLRCPFSRHTERAMATSTHAPSPLIPHKTFRDPVHGDIHLTAIETAVVDTADFQRLGRIRQLGTAHLLYRGALHTRFDHALGTLAVAKRMIQAINENPRSDRINEEAHVLIRLCALLHDIPHVPFGHTFEDELGLARRHDDADRFADFLGPQSDIGNLIANGVGEKMRRLVLETLQARGDEEISALEYPFASDLVGNTLCADLLDYLRRDCYFAGLPENFAERIFDYLFIPTTGQHARRIVVRLNKLKSHEIRKD